MSDSAARVFGNVLIAAALVLVVFSLGDREVATAVVGIGLLLAGCLLRIEAAIVRGQPPTVDPPRRDPALTRRGPDSKLLHLPERTGPTRPWQEPEDQEGPEPSR